MPPAAVALDIAFAQESSEFTLTWEDAQADSNDGYYVYQVVKGQYIRLGDARRPAGSTSWTFPLSALDDSGGNLYTFVVTAVTDLAGEEGELESVYSNEVSYVPVLAGPEGPAGKSAYQIAVENGFVGTVAEWIASLHGKDVGVDRIEKTGTSADGLIDTYTIFFTDGNSSTFTVNNGQDGVAGADGRGIVSFEKTGSNGNIDTYTVTYTDETTSTFTVRNGTDGVGVEKIEKTASSADGLIDTYTITLTNGQTIRYSITNGNGVRSIERLDPSVGTGPNVDTYLVKMTNGDMYTFTVRNGLDGKSAYEIAVENGFQGSVLEWLASLKGEGIRILNISSAAVDDLTTAYTFLYSDGTTYTFKIKNGEKGDDGSDGRNGKDGIGVQDIKILENGDLIFKMTNNQTIKSGNLIEVLSTNAFEEFITTFYGGNPLENVLPFVDVGINDYYYKSVIWAYESMITEGTSANTFSPLAICTRAQVVTFLWRVAGCPEPENGKNPFIDISEREYFYKPVLWAVQQGITKGTSADRFSPYLRCTNSHILTFLYRAMGEPGRTGVGKWYSDAYSWSTGCGLLTGTYSGSFDMEAACPRCNVVEYLYRYLAMKD